MSLLSNLPAPKHKYSAPELPESRWERDLAVVETEAPERSVMGKVDNTKADFWQVVPKGPDAARNPHPDDDTVRDTVNSTMAALSRVVDRKLVASNPKAINPNSRPGGPQYIKYTPKQVSKQHNSGVDSRVIQMQEMPVDPLDPPKFRHQKVPRVPDSTPVPVLHSPPRPVTKEDQVNWRVPPCVSAWKNNKGYTIPLDKRLAADGRGMQEQTINKKHMDLAQALYAAEETARRETELQARLQAEIKQRQKVKKEEQLRQLAAQARMGGATATASQAMASRLDDAEPSTVPAYTADEDLPPPPPRAGSSRSAEAAYPPPPNRGLSREDDHDAGRHRQNDRRDHDGSGDTRRRDDDRGDDRRRDDGREHLSRKEQEAKRERDELRRERARERERELRLEEKNAAGAKRSKLTRDRDRDVSEKIALGQANVRGNEVQYDSRLFNRDAGIGSGFVGDDAYNVYDKALFTDRSAVNMYRARDTLDADVYGGDKGGKDVDTNRFKPDKGFSGTDAGAATRTGPVQFEKEADPFGIDSFLGGVKKK